MEKNFEHFIRSKNISYKSEINFHNFIDMVDSGLNDEEIANEFNVNKKYIQTFKNQLNNDIY